MESDVSICVFSMFYKKINIMNETYLKKVLESNILSIMPL